MAKRKEAAELGSDEEWDDVGFVISSDYRVIALNELAEAKSTPAWMAEEMEAEISTASRALQTLEERGLAELMVSEERSKGRIYSITDKGRRIQKTIEEISKDPRENMDGYYGNKTVGD